MGNCLPVDNSVVGLFDHQDIRECIEKINELILVRLSGTEFDGLVATQCELLKKATLSAIRDDDILLVEDGDVFIDRVRFTRQRFSDLHGLIKHRNETLANALEECARSYVLHQLDSYRALLVRECLVTYAYFYNLLCGFLNKITLKGNETETLGVGSLRLHETGRTGWIVMMIKKLEIELAQRPPVDGNIVWTATSCFESTRTLAIGAAIDTFYMWLSTAYVIEAGQLVNQPTTPNRQTVYGELEAQNRKFPFSFARSKHKQALVDAHRQVVAILHAAHVAAIQEKLKQ